MRIEIKKATVIKVLDSEDAIQRVLLDYGGGHQAEAIAYTCFVNNLSPGAIVLANTTANKLALGTGGYDFIICNLSNPITEKVGNREQGHIIKLPYTPLQFAVLSAEEEDSKYHDVFDGNNDLAGTPVIICGLHSHIMPAASMLKYHKPDIKIAYIMTDAAALPAAVSDTVRILKGLTIDTVVTCGNAFGGDIEAVNIYSGLLAAKYAVGSRVSMSDIIIVSMGPGVKGTETCYGHSSIEQGWIIDAVNNLSGIPVYCPRVSFADKRARHKGISHHSLAVLTRIAKTGANVVFPAMDEKQKREFIDLQIESSGLGNSHRVIFKRADDTIKALEGFKLSASSMGRAFEDDPYFFKTAGSAALLALELLESG